jgi:transmembrane sensor
MSGESHPPPRGSRLDAAGRRIQRRAAEWLALRGSRGFTTAEHASFAEWCAADPRHAEIFAEVESAWSTFDRLSHYPHAPDREANPDLLAPPRKPVTWPAGVLAGLAAAAAIAVAGLVWTRRPAPPAPPPAAAAPASVAAAEPRLLRLSDGSVAELNTGTELSEHFTDAERRVRLLRGEAHFTVVHNPERPFIVEAGLAAIRAVGTAFNVRFRAATVEVLVTEGHVEVQAPPWRGAPAAGARPPAQLHAGQRTFVPAADGADAGAAVVETLDPAAIDRELAWQASRLSFDDQPLSEIAARFNRASAEDPARPRLVIGDAEVGSLRVSGRLRADDLGRFVEVLQSNFGIVAERSPDGEIVLRRRPTGP